MRIPLEELNDEQFEHLCKVICTEILGIGTITFTTGPDGGRDGAFTGRAQKYPSQNGAWDGKMIIQCKHTGKYNAKCGDSDFQGMIFRTTEKRKCEKDKMQQLKDDNLIDYYMLFTNRGQSGGMHGDFTQTFINEIGLTGAVIFDGERIQEEIKSIPNIYIKCPYLKAVMLPLEFDAHILSEIIAVFKDWAGEHDKVVNSLDKISIEEKVRINNMTGEYFENVFKPSYTYFKSIEDFFKSPLNKNLRDDYLDIADDLNAKIIVHAVKFETFDEIIIDMIETVKLSGNEALRGNYRFIRTIIHYMFFMCHLGKTKEG